MAGRDPSSRNASYIWRSATPLSKGMIGMSPQSFMVAQALYGLIPARVLKDVPAIWRALAARMARGPKRAPFFTSLSPVLRMRISCRGKGRTWSIANSGIKRRADNGDVVALVGLDKAFYGLEVREAGDAGEGPLRLLVRLIRDDCRGEWRGTS